MTTLREKVRRLAAQHPELRGHLGPLLSLRKTAKLDLSDVADALEAALAGGQTSAYLSLDRHSGRRLLKSTGVRKKLVGADAAALVAWVDKYLGGWHQREHGFLARANAPRHRETTNGQEIVFTIRDTSGDACPTCDHVDEEKAANARLVGYLLLEAPKEAPAPYAIDDFGQVLGRAGMQYVGDTRSPPYKFYSDGLFDRHAKKGYVIFFWGAHASKRWLPMHGGFGWVNGAFSRPKGIAAKAGREITEADIAKWARAVAEGNEKLRAAGKL